MYFRYFIIFSLGKKVGPFIWTNLSPHHPRMHCANFGWNWSSGSWEDAENTEGGMDVWSGKQTDRQTDRKAHLSFQLRWAKKFKTKLVHGDKNSSINKLHVYNNTCIKNHDDGLLSTNLDHPSRHYGGLFLRFLLIWFCIIHNSQNLILLGSVKYMYFFWKQIL